MSEGDEQIRSHAFYGIIAKDTASLETQALREAPTAESAVGARGRDDGHRP